MIRRVLYPGCIAAAVALVLVPTLGHAAAQGTNIGGINGQPNQPDDSGSLAVGDTTTTVGTFDGNGDPDTTQQQPTKGTAVGIGATVTGDKGTAVGNSATASGTDSTAVGQGASATGAESTAVGQGATASGDNSSAYGQGATASGKNSSAFGAGAQATADNQMAFGTSTNTYTFAGIGSQASKDAQQGPLNIVTTDSNGNLAGRSASELGLATTGDIANLRSGLNDAMRKIDENTQGIAIAMAMSGLAIPDSKNFAIGANYGFYDGKQALATQVAVRVDRNVVLNAGIGTGLNFQSKFGGRIGFTAAW